MSTRDPPIPRESQDAQGKLKKCPAFFRNVVCTVYKHQFAIAQKDMLTEIQKSG